MKKIDVLYYFIGHSPTQEGGLMKEMLNTSRVCVAFFFLTVLIDEFPFVFQIFMYPYAIKDNLTGQAQTVETNWLLKANRKPRNLSIIATKY